MLYVKKKLFRLKVYCMTNVCWANEVKLMEYLNIWSTLLNINTIRIKEKTKTISTSLIMIKIQTATTTNQVLTVSYIGWRNTWMGPKCVCVYKQDWSRKCSAWKAEILLIWTNVPRTNVAWTNVVLTVVICPICSQDPLLKVWSKLGQ